jgi:hypothetical protein
MKSKISILFLIMALSLFLHHSCTTSEDAGQYTLTVTVSEGVNGIPATGTYSYNENEVVTYNYSLQSGYENLVVTLDGVAVGNNGIITMNINHTLTVTADEIFDVTGTWNGTWYYGYVESQMECTFTGGLYSGTLTGDIDYISGTGSGPYTIIGDTIQFELNYGGGVIKLNGTIEDNNHMSGTWTAEPGSASGDWEMER